MKKFNSNKNKKAKAFTVKGAAALIIAALLLAAVLLLTGCPTPTPTPKPKHAITFSVDGGNGTLKAKADGVDETSTSPINVEAGKTVTFTATADDGYKVDKWTVTPAEALQDGTGADGSESAKVKITADTTVSVSFTKKTYAVNFSVDSTTPNGTLKAEGDGITQPATSPITVEHGKEVTFTATADDGYRVKGWTLDGNAVNGTAETYTLAVTQPATVKVSFELIPQAILTLSPDKLTIEVKAKTADGNPITVEGCNEATLESDKKTKLTATGTRVVLKGNITELSCGGNQLTALNVQGCASLQKLDCHKNQLTELNLQGLTSLQELNCYSNRELSTLDVQGCTALQKLDCSDNQLSTFNVQGCTALQKLDCSDNQLSTFNVQGLTSLKVLECYSNRLTSLNVQGCTSLQVLNCHNNKLTELNVQGLKALQELDCSNNQLTALNVQGLTALQTLGCFDNKLNAQAMTELLNALPAREAGDNAIAVLYTEFSGEEGNCKDYNTPEDLKKAFDGAKKRHWRLRKLNANGRFEDI